MTTTKGTSDDEGDDRIEFTITVRPSQLAAFAAIFRPPTPAPTPTPSAAHALITKKELANTLRVSVTKIDRLVHDGLPHETVGSVRRFDLDACRAWLNMRGKKATTPAAKPPEEDSIDISRAVRRAGLRAVGGRTK
jgi:excisionase family DNA binding protein